ncbi:MAG: HK97 gp10 family phage protein [Microbispora sp.]|nr:HK97 gp10 family phage protein [Microbispora sp.]
MAVTGTEELRRFIADLGKVPEEIRKELRPRLRKVGQAALTDVKARASWSSRIPGATRLSISLAKRDPGVSIVVDRKKAPHARPHEHGGRPGTFRHPLFGNRQRWVEQRARPFLWPGARPHFEQADRDIAAAVDEVARKAGFR